MLRPLVGFGTAFLVPVRRQVHSIHRHILSNRCNATTARRACVASVDNAYIL
uniref:Uncharacterized protein n=1 Tax=Zea mays TaxID=4577 RepID=C4J113_MAIZE|nr:unknown [Zea mays]